MLLRPTIPGIYIVPSIARDILVLWSSCLICSGVKIGFKTYLMSLRDESAIFSLLYYFQRLSELFTGSYLTTVVTNKI